MGSLFQNFQGRSGGQYCRLLSLVALIYCGLLSAQVRDGAGLFSADARNKFETQNKLLQKYYKAGLSLDTFSQAPGLNAQAGGAQQSTPEFNTWLKNRAEKGGRDNVYILVVQNPPYL
ncbi:MAG: hypothetical protein KDD51_17315, partial [Bdellovibrionales bacterium]|nr:hypothetical protein [Bdellovibrionales bacterium]